MSEREYEALRSALASTRMEGFEVTEQTEKDCIRLMSGEVSVADLVKEILARPATMQRSKHLSITQTIDRCFLHILRFCSQ